MSLRLHVASTVVLVGLFISGAHQACRPGPPKASPDEVARAAQQKVVEDSIRVQCRIMGGTPADRADPEAFRKRIEKQMQDKVDLFNRGATEELERKTRPPGKQRLHSVTEART